MNPELVKRYSGAVPRYTSYPTAPHFSDEVGAAQYASWLAMLPEQARLSLYIHIPFCSALCWYCGCSTKVANRYEPVASYLSSLRSEIANVAARVPASHSVTHVHWGGGSPNILTPDDIPALAETTRRSFNVAEGAEFAVEIDPRGLDRERVAAFARAGVTRASIGVQDFDETVQSAINRRQSFALTQAAVEALREHGIGAINIDLVYGLPHQTRDSVEATVSKVLALEPSRIAAFGYAHLPARLKHQALIDEAPRAMCASASIITPAPTTRSPAAQSTAISKAIRLTRPMPSSGSALPRSAGCPKATFRTALPCPTTTAS